MLSRDERAVIDWWPSDDARITAQYFAALHIVCQDSAAVAEPTEAVAEPETKRAAKTDRRKKPKRQPPYNVVLWDDDAHTFAYVILMLLELFGHPPEKGYQLAQEVHTRGKVIVLTTTREHAELKRDQIHAHGKDDLVANCKGSMWATIEPLEGT